MTAVRFGFFLVRARTHMDPNKWVIFAYVSKPSESNNQGRHLAYVPVAPYHGEAKALEIPLGELELSAVLEALCRKINLPVKLFK